MECRARGYFLFPCCSHGEASLLHGLLSLGIFGRRQGQPLAGGQALPSTIFASRRRAVKNINFEEDGGGRGIRTPGTLSGTAVFKTACFNRSHIPPQSILSVRERQAGVAAVAPRSPDGVPPGDIPRAVAGHRILIGQFIRNKRRWRRPLCEPILRFYSRWPLRWRWDVTRTAPGIPARRAAAILRQTTPQPPMILLPPRAAPRPS